MTSHLTKEVFSLEDLQYGVCRGHIRASQKHKEFASQFATPHWDPDWQFKIEHHKLDFSFDFESKTVFGIAEPSMRIVKHGITSVSLEAVDLIVETVEDDSGIPLSFSVGDTTLRVNFPSPLNEGQLVKIRIKYKIIEPKLGVYFVGPDDEYPDLLPQVWTQGHDEDSKYYFPCLDLPREKATSEVILTIPEKMTGLSNGELLVEEKLDNGLKRVHWRFDTPHSTYLIAFAVGEFDVIRDEWDGIPIESYCTKGRLDEAKNSFENIKDIVQWFSEVTGLRYPYPGYKQVAVQRFVFGGMENTTLTILTDLTLHDDRAHIDISSDPLVSHEFAHMYFGDLLTCKNWAHAWLNEGFATYFEALWCEHFYGEDEFHYNMLYKQKKYIAEDVGQYRRPLVLNIFDEPIDLFDAHLYPGGAARLHMLRHHLGDEPWWRAIRTYVADNAEGLVETVDLQRAIEKATGRDFAWFFDQWFYKTGYPEFALEFAWDEEAKMAAIKVKQTQKVEGLTPIFAIKTKLMFVFSDGSQHDFPIRCSEAEQHFHCPLKEKPVMARFDPGNWILKTLKFKRPKKMLLHQLKHDSDITGQIEAAEALSKSRDAAVIAALRDHMLNPNTFWGVQSEIAGGLGKMKSEPARDCLIEALQIEHPKARNAVVVALSEFKEDKTVAAALTAFAQSDPSYKVEAEANKALGKIRARNAADILLKSLDKPSWGDIIMSAALEGLAELEKPELLETIKDCADYGQPAQGRLTAAYSMATLASRLEDIHKQKTVEALTSHLNDLDFRMVTTTIRALGKLAHPAAIPELQRLTMGDIDGRIKKSARKALEAINDSMSKPKEIAGLRKKVELLEKSKLDMELKLAKLEARIKVAEKTKGEK